GQNVPLVMRGPAEVTSWSASKLGALDEDTLARITDLYAADPLLSVRLADALAANAIASADGAGSLAALAPDTAVRDTSAAGLSARALYQGRDLQPTLDLRSVLKGVLQEHLLVPPRELEHTVFPDSRTARPLTGLVRT